MKRILSTLTLLAALLVASAAGATTFLPDSAGNHWTYESASSRTTARITHSSSNWRRYDDFAGMGPQWIWTYENRGEVYGWNPNRGAMKLFDSSAPVGRQYNAHISNCGPERITIAGKNERLHTSAGTFRDVLRVNLSTACRDAGTSTIWFAPKVGIVKWEAITIAGATHYEFTSGTVEGVDFPVRTPPPVTIHMAPSRDTLWLNLMPVVGPPRKHDTAVSTVFTVENSGDRQIDLRFPTSQRFDIYVEDENGRVVRTWSANKSFLQATSTVSLKPGDEVSYEGTVELPAEAGRYRLRMELTSTNRHFAAETSIDVTAVY